MELLEYLRRALKLDYISDLRLKKLKTAQVLTLLGALQMSNPYTEKEWDEAFRYLLGGERQQTGYRWYAVLGLLLSKTVSERRGDTWLQSP